MKKELFVLGGGGFVGRETLRAAVSQGWKVKALARSPAAGAAIAALGAAPILGDAAQPDSWVEQARGARALIDLIQPRLPRRIGTRQLDEIASYRARTAEAVASALRRLPDSVRPVYFGVSGTADLALDRSGKISDRSGLAERPKGFAKIGIPVRRIIEGSGIPAAYVYLGFVYGPGKVFADTMLPRLSKGRLPIIGKGQNRFALVHVADAAAALLHLIQAAAAEVAGRTWVVADGTNRTLADFFSTTAAILGAPRPRRIPRWLGAALLGTGAVDELCKDVPVDPSALLSTGFRFQYPRLEEGVSATLQALHGRCAEGV